MLLILITSSIILAVSCMVMILASILSKKTFSDREKSSPFECGFDPSSSARVPFSLRFFLITIIFLIFDVEIALILPMAITMEPSSFMAWSCTALGFIFILLVGLYHEWNQGMLSWSA